MAVLVHPIRATKCAAAATARQRTSAGPRRHSPIAARAAGQAAVQYQSCGRCLGARPGLRRRSASSESEQASKTPARAGVGNVVSVLVRVTNAAPCTSRRCPCGPDPWPDHSAPGSCPRADPAAGDDVEIVVGELAPLLLHLPFDLLPIPSTRFQSISKVPPIRASLGKRRRPKNVPGLGNFYSLHRFSAAANSRA